MKAELTRKYRRTQPFDFPDRTWPSRTISAPPRWCSVDLRDGNQALITPMSAAEKTEFFRLLVEVGFKEIEIAFPSASETDFRFTRSLIENGEVPDDVTVQVLTQAREHLIRRTFEALEGLPRAVVHLYNSTSTQQREIVFQKSRDEIKRLAVEGVELIRRLASETRTEIILEYSPESFTGTELDFALEVSEAVIEAWQPTAEKKLILNLPATVELYTPNLYADRIEWFDRHLNNRENVVISLHAHNDRGTAVAATELGLMAGADRVEGTLFGNGERTGNVDIITLALNLYSQGVDPLLNLHQMERIIDISTRCTRIPVGMRHPYAGALVYTAFSGSHQDAINKGMKAQRRGEYDYWNVPYLPIDPADLGFTYQAIIRINSQSGKGGVAYLLDEQFGYQLPKEMHPEFATIVQRMTDETGREITPSEIHQLFVGEYLEQQSPVEYLDHETLSRNEKSGEVHCRYKLKVKDREQIVEGKGNGPLDALRHALDQFDEIEPFQIAGFYEHSLGEGSDARAVSYIKLQDHAGNLLWGAGLDGNIAVASIKATLSAINRRHNGSAAAAQLSTAVQKSQ